MPSHPSIQLGWDNASLNAGAAKAASTVSHFEQHAQHSLKHLGEFSREALSFLGVGLGIEGLHRIAEEFGRIGVLAKQLDESPETIQRIGIFAEHSGSDVESVARAMNRLNKEIAQGNSGKAFEQLGLRASEFLKLDADKQIIELARAFQNAEHNGTALDAAYDLFGKTAAEVFPLLRKNVAELEDLSHSKVLNEGEIEKVEILNHKYADLVKTVKTTGASIALTAVDWGKAAAAGINNLFDGGDGMTAFMVRLNQIRDEEQKVIDEGEKLRKAHKEAFAAELIGTLNAELAKQADLTHEAALAAEGQLETVDKLRLAREKLAATQAGGDEGPLPEEDELRLEIEIQKAKQSVLKLEKEYGDQVRKDGEEEQKKLDAAQKQAEAQREALGHFRAENAVLAEQAAGHEKKAEAMQKALKTAETAQRLQKEAGISEEAALKLARERADLEDKINKHKGAGAHHISGYSHSQREANPFLHRSSLDAHYADMQTPFFVKHSPDFGVTHRASAADRARTSASASAPRDSGPEIVRLLSSLNATFEKALN